MTLQEQNVSETSFYSNLCCIDTKVSHKAVLLASFPGTSKDLLLWIRWDIDDVVAM